MNPIKYNSDITSYKDPRINEFPAEIREKKREEIRKEYRLYKFCFLQAFLYSITVVGVVFFFALTMEGHLTVFNYFISVFVSTIVIVFPYLHAKYNQAVVRSPLVPMSGNEELKYYGTFDFREEWVIKEIDVFKRFDESKIVIDATEPGRIAIPIAILFIVTFLVFCGVYPFGDDVDPIIPFAENMVLLLGYSICLCSIIYYLLYSPKSLVVFDRKSKTITIPAKWVFSKGETIPYNEAVILFGEKVEMSEYRGDERITIANPNRLLHNIAMRFY